MPKSIIPYQGIALAVDPFRRKQAKYRLFIYWIDFLVRPTSRVSGPDTLWRVRWTRLLDAFDFPIYGHNHIVESFHTL